MWSGIGGRRDVEALELSDQELDRRRLGLLVHAVEQRLAPARQLLRHLLVGEDHQLLDQAVRLGLHVVDRPHDVPVRVELELGLGRLDAERAAREAALPQGTGDLARQRERLGDLLGSGGAVREHPLDLVVAEARVGADQAAVERRWRAPRPAG